MTVADQLVQLASTKSAIAAAIESKGVTVGSVPFADYPSEIEEISGGEGVDPWVRPPEWLELPEVLSTDEKFVGLHAVLQDGNFVALVATGDYTVDWGDGVVENFASGVQANHEYSFSDPDLTTTALPYKQAVVTVTPQAGKSLTSLNLSVKHSQVGLQNAYASGWLDFRISGPNFGASGLVISSIATYTIHRRLERAELLNAGGVTNMNNMFNSCSLLRSVSLSNTAAVTDMGNMFTNCSSLTAVSLSNTAAVTNMGNMFTNCSSLTAVSLSNTAAVTNMGNMFSGCSSLRSVPLFNTAVVTAMNGMFGSCPSLSSVPLFNTAAVTNMSGMFSGCSSLTTVPLFNTAAVTNMGSIFAGCSSLIKVSMLGAKVTFSVASCKLSATALNEIYTNLASVSGQTLTVTGNYGTSGDDPSIATTKGWTVTG